VEPTSEPGRAITDDELEALRSSIARDETAFLADLERLVNIDCGSYTPGGVDAIGAFVATFLGDAGASVDVRPDPSGRLGATVIGTWAGDRATPG